MKAVVVQPLRVFAFDNHRKVEVYLPQGLSVQCQKDVGQSIACSVGNRNFGMTLIIPKSSLRLHAQDDEESTEQPAEVTVGYPELSPEQQEEPGEFHGLYSLEELQKEVAGLSEEEKQEISDELEESEFQKEHLQPEEFERYQEHLMRRSKVAEKLRRRLKKKNPELSEDQIDGMVKEIYQQHVSKKVMQELEGQKPTREEIKLSVPPLPTESPAGGKQEGPPQGFFVSPDVKRLIPEYMRKELGVKPMGWLNIPGNEKRFRIEQVSPFYPEISLYDLKTGFYTVMNSPESAHWKGVEIVNIEKEMATNPMPVNPKTGRATIRHEGYVVERVFDPNLATMYYIFYHPRRPEKYQEGGATLKETKDMIDNMVLERIGVT